MPSLRFPFWILVPSDPVPDGGCDTPRHVATFSSATRAAAFMEAAETGRWDVRLVSRSSRPEVKALFERFGITRVCHDRNPDRTGGTEMTAKELLAAWAI